MASHRGGWLRGTAAHHNTASRRSTRQNSDGRPSSLSNSLSCSNSVSCCAGSNRACPAAPRKQQQGQQQCGCLLPAPHTHSMSRAYPAHARCCHDPFTAAAAGAMSVFPPAAASGKQLPPAIRLAKEVLCTHTNTWSAPRTLRGCVPHPSTPCWCTDRHSRVLLPTCSQHGRSSPGLVCPGVNHPNAPAKAKS